MKREKVKIKKKLTESHEDMRRLLECGANRVREIASSIPFSNSNSNQSSFITFASFKTEPPRLELNSSAHKCFALLTYILFKLQIYF